MNILTAQAYITGYHAKFGETVEITACEFVSDGVVQVTFWLAGHCNYADVWLEGETPYGEW